MQEYREKMKVLTNDFELLLQSKFTEGKLLSVHKNGLWKLNHEARKISKDKKMQENEAMINDKFEKMWNKVRNTLIGGNKIENFQTTYKENLSKTFQGVNNFMEKISATDFKKILAFAKCEGERIGDFPLALHNYLSD